MAQGDPFKIGIHIPLANSKFEYVDQVIYIKTAIASPGSSVTIDTASDKIGTVLDARTSPFVVAVGNELVLGPSNHADNPGAIETVTVLTIGSTSFTADVINKYAAGDQITARTVPVGWTPEATVVAGKKFEVVANKLLGVSGDLDTGKATRITRNDLITAALTPDTHYNLRSAYPDTVYNRMSYIYAEMGVNLWNQIVHFNMSAYAGKTIISGNLVIAGNSSAAMYVGYLKRNWTVSGNSPSHNNYADATAWQAAGGLGTNDIGSAGYTISHPSPITVSLSAAVLQNMLDVNNYGFLIYTDGNTYFNISSITLNLVIAETSDSNHLFSRTTNVNTVLPANGAHRYAMWVKNSGTYDQCKHQIAELTAGGAGVTTHEVAHAAAYSDFTELSGTFTPNASTSKIQLLNLIEHAITAVTTLTVGNIILTHAKGTDDTADGVYTFDDIPIAKSQDYGYYSGRKKISLVNNTVGFSDASDGRVRWWYTASFTWASQSLYDNLLTLLGQIAHDQKLVLFPSLINLPPVIIGELTVTPFKKASTNLSYDWFTLNFEGC